MKKAIIAITALLFTTGAMAQTEVTAGVMRGKDYGVTYLLPKTEIEIVLHATKHTYTPGEFCKYADRYLRLNNVSADPQEYWTLDKIETRSFGIPDKANVYFVKLKDKTAAPLMELTEDGIVRSINMPYSGKKTEISSSPAPSKKVTESIDPRNFLTEEILMANSSAKMAELIAKEIYTIRESKNALLRGEADNMPKDGEQLKLMIDNLTMQEKAMTEMFAGSTSNSTENFTIRITPKEMKNNVAFRFSKKLGVVSKDNLAGEPYFITIVNQHVPQIPAIDAGEKKKELEGVVYNVPGRGKVTLTHNNETLYEAEIPITQFGCTEFLAPILFNKNSVIKVLFDTHTGALLKIDRGEQ
ncbi:MAG: DUF4831 family protein [Bacteroides sp.]|nr:DUF4831 family protein [Bacteroides sp.]